MKAKFDPRPMYDIYLCVINFRDHLCGGVPKNEDLIHTWIKARTGHDDEKTKEQVKEALETLVADAQEASSVGFAGDEKGLFIHTRQVKAMIKQGASMLGITTKKRGSKQIFAEGCEVKALGGHAERIYLGKTAPDGVAEKPIHVMTAQGPRTAIKRVEYVSNVTLKFEIWILKTASAENRHIGEEDLLRVLVFSQENGLGADRSQSEGKFDIIEFAPAPE